MNYNWDFSIPITATKSSPKIALKRVTYGTIKRVIISNPAGSVGKSGLQVYFHEFQLFPLNKGAWYSGEKLYVSFEDNYCLYTSPYELKFKGYNESTLYSHAFNINVTIMREDLSGREGVLPQLSGMVGEI